jgi:4-hydroxy-tetrahydrodipicolinate synthase
MGAPKKDLGRLMTAMVTPFRADGSLDLGQAEALASYLVEAGNDGVVVGGTTGESPTLSHEEKVELYRAVRGAIPKNTVIMGTGTNNTRASIEMSRDAVKLGADAVLCVVPYYNKPPQKSLYAHFKAIADATDGEVILYNVPTRTVANMEAATTIRLSEIANIVAIKEASPDLSQCAAIAAGMAPGFRIYSGEDSLTLSMLAVGAYGVISVAGHFAAPGIRALVEAHARGDVAEAARLQGKLMPIYKGVFVTASPVPTKALFRRLGFELGDTRLPLSMEEISEEQVDALQRVVQDLGRLAAKVPQGVAARV